MTLSAIFFFAISSKFIGRDSAPWTRCFSRVHLERLFFVAGLIVLSCIAVPKGFAQELDTRIAGPFYHEKSHRYFELHRLPGFVHQYNWEFARQAASRRVHGNVRGQLAVVDSSDVHNFLVQKFNFPGETWIGLRYFCGTKKLLWINGKVHKPGEFSVWHPQWAGNPDITCFNQSFVYMGAYYTGKGSYLWQLQGYMKAFPWYLVQYRMPS